MGFTVRDSEEKVVGGPELMTGVALTEIVAISPTVEQMKTVLGFDDPKEPFSNVDTDNDGNQRVRLDFWYSVPQMEGFLHRESFFVTKKERKTQDGLKKQWTNNFAQFCYSRGDEAPSYDWFQNEGARPAFEGEEQLVDMLRAWINHKGGKKGEEFYFDNWDAIFTGNVSEFQGLLEQANHGVKNSFYVLYGVKTSDSNGKTNQYQGTYRKMYARSYQNPYSTIGKALADEYGAYKHDYQNSLDWQQYKGNVAAILQNENAQPAGQPAEAGDSPWN